MPEKSLTQAGSATAISPSVQGGQLRVQHACRQDGQRRNSPVEVEFRRRRRRRGQASAVAATDDGGFVVAGDQYIDTGDDKCAYDDAYLVKLDAAGCEAWRHSYGGDCTEFGWDMTKREGGGYVLVGDTYSFGDEDSFSVDVYIVATDGDGNEVACQVYGGRAPKGPTPSCRHLMERS